jgi:DNA-directed RNA polymerase specialized sigma24 family protein
VNCIECFVRDFYDDIKKICLAQVGEKYAEDLTHDIILVLLTREDDKYSGMCERNELLWYLIRWIKLCHYSKTTRFYYKYKRWAENVTFEYPMNAVGNLPDTFQEMNYKEQLAEIEKLLEDIYWFEAELFKIYYLHNHSINTLTNATGISRKTIQISIKKAKDYIEEKIKRPR